LLLDLVAEDMPSDGEVELAAADFVGIHMPSGTS
jgi:hypothetical protein